MLCPYYTHAMNVQRTIVNLTGYVCFNFQYKCVYWNCDQRCTFLYKSLSLVLMTMCTCTDKWDYSKPCNSLHTPLVYYYSSNCFR